MLKTSATRPRTTAYVWLTLGMFAVFLAIFALYVYAEKKIDRANEQRHLSFLLANELRQSSDDLTRMVRSYVATGDLGYKRHYQEILDIRDGVRPRPVCYQSVYWDLVLPDDLRPCPPGKAIPLLNSMQAAGFTKEEFARLAEAKASSDALTHTEFFAMRLLESTSPATEAHRAEATRLLHDHAYHQAKANIMRPISQFYQAMDRRTLNAVLASENRATQVRIGLVLVGVLLFFLILSMRRSRLAILGGSVEEVYAGISRLVGDEPSAPIVLAAAREDSVLGRLSQAQIRLAQFESDRNSALFEQKKMNRALRLLSDCNLAMISIREEEILLSEICRLIVETGGYRMVWIGLAQPDKSVQPVAHAGAGAQAYLANIRVSWDDRLDIGHGPTGTAIRTGATRINQDYSTNLKMAPWRSAASKQGYQSSVALPLSLAGKALGALTLYAVEPDAFNADEVALLEELAGNVGFGMETLRTRAQVEAAEAASVAKSAFLANMSHEIRTPLNGILGIAYLMRRASVTPQQAGQLDKIAASGKHLLAIINDVLDLSKIEAGKLVLEEKDFRLSDMLNATVTVMADAIAAKGLRFLIKISSMPQDLRGDPTRLSQVLVNYLGNALKFTEQGSITLSAQVLEETDTDYLLRFEVSDTGIGMTEEQRVRIFQPFEQGDNSISRKYGGTGLGLVITRRIAALMGGAAGVENAQGEGSTFWFTVRLGRGGLTEIEAHTIHADAMATLLRDHAGTRILLTEDDPINQEIALDLLRDAGLEADLADDGVSACLKAQNTDYALILMDMQMPGMDGLEATRAIRLLPGREATPIVAMTANAFAEDRQRCFDAGMVDFIPKPVMPEVLYATLVKWLSRRQAPS